MLSFNSNAINVECDNNTTSIVLHHCSMVALYLDSCISCSVVIVAIMIITNRIIIAQCTATYKHEGIGKEEQERKISVLYCRVVHFILELKTSHSTILFNERKCRYKRTSHFSSFVFRFIPIIIFRLRFTSISSGINDVWMPLIYQHSIDTCMMSIDQGPKFSKILLVCLHQISVVYHISFMTSSLLHFSCFVLHIRFFLLLFYYEYYYYFVIFEVSLSILLLSYLQPTVQSHTNNLKITKQKLEFKRFAKVLLR